MGIHFWVRSTGQIINLTDKELGYGGGNEGGGGGGGRMKIKGMARKEIG